MGIQGMELQQYRGQLHIVPQPVRGEGRGTTRSVQIGLGFRV